MFNNDNSIRNLIFPPKFCEVLNATREKSIAANSLQVAEDVARRCTIFVKNQGSTDLLLGDAHSEPTQRQKVFFGELENFPIPFQQFINVHFHQGGQLYTGIRFLDETLRELGFKPTDSDREFIFDLQGDQLVVEEVIKVKELKYIPQEGIFRKFLHSTENEEYLPLNDDQKANIELVRQQLEDSFSKGDSFECDLNWDKEGIPDGLKIEDKDPFPKETDSESTLLTFKIRHRVRLNDKRDGIDLCPFESDDFSLKAHSKLFLNNKNESHFFHNHDLDSFLLPNLAVTSYQKSYKNQNLKAHLTSKIIKYCQEFLFVVLTILIHYVRKRISNESNNFKQLEETDNFTSPPRMRT